MEPYEETSIQPLPSGDAATALILTHLRSFVVQSQTSALAHAAVQDALAGVAEKSPHAEASALLAWVRNRLRYTQDPVEVELIRDPRYSLRAIQHGGAFFGDCDDAAVLLATLLETAGYPTRFVVQGEEGEPFQHVLVEVELDGEWTPADVTNRSAALGWKSPTLGRVAHENRGHTMRGAVGRLGEGDGPTDVALPLNSDDWSWLTAWRGTDDSSLDAGAAADMANASATLAQAVASSIGSPQALPTPSAQESPSVGSFFSDLFGTIRDVAPSALSIAERVGLYKPVAGYDAQGRPIYAATTIPASGTQAGFTALTQTLFGIPVWLLLVGGVGAVIVFSGPSRGRRR